MSPNLLILGGTTEATALCNLLAEQGFHGTVSFAGRVERPKRQPLPQRIGGFGGSTGLADYLRAQKITHLIDATHPFAAQMSRNAVDAAALVDVPLVALTRPGWTRRADDKWIEVPDIPAAVAALDQPARRVMLAVGRMHLNDFAPNPQHHYLLRLVDPPQFEVPFPDHHVLVSRGPFTEASDRTLMEAHRIDIVVSKNSGGVGAKAKIDAARALGLPVIMIARPDIPARSEVGTAQEVVDWIVHAGTERGV